MIPARMSLADCARAAAAAHRRARAIKPPAPSPMRRRNLGYKGADLNRLTYDWIASRVPADEEIRGPFARLRARARDLARNNPYVRQYLNLLRVNVIGPTGARLQARVKNNDGRPNKMMNDKIERAWADWSKAPTVDGKQDLAEFQQLAVETVAKDGEAVILLHRAYDNPYGFALEAVDPDQLDETYHRPPGERLPEIRMGVEVDVYGRPLAYHLWDGPLFAGFPQPERKRLRIAADRVIHLYRMDRPNLTRGVTWLAPVMFALNMLDGYEDAEITACRLAASAMGVFTRKDAGAEAPMGENNQVDFEANPGSFMFAPEGYDLTSWDPQHPNANYQAFVKGALRKIASGLGLSYNVLANDLEGVNYSSMRSGLGIERDLWKTNQRWWICAFLQPVYAAWLDMALLTGGLVLDTRAPSRFLDVRWVPRGWPPVDPLDDTDAGIKEVQTGLGTRTEMLAEQGRDFEETLELLKQEEELASEYGVDISGPKSEVTSKKPAVAKEKEAPDEDEEERTARNRVAALVNGRNGHA